MRRSTVKLVIIAAVPIVLISVFIISLIWSGGHFYRYRLFKADLARSTAYSQVNNCLRAEYANEITRIHPDNAERIYKQITTGNFVIEAYEIPAVGGILLDFGDGAVLQIWPAQPSGVLLSFQADDGERYDFMTGELSRFSIIESLVQPAGLNTPNEPWSP